MTADAIPFPTIRAKRAPIAKQAGDNLEEISTPENIEAQIESVFIAAWMKALGVFGIEKATDINVRAAAYARKVMGRD